MGGMTAVSELEDARHQALRKKWAYVARLCREAAEAASLYEDPAKVRLAVGAGGEAHRGG